MAFQFQCPQGHLLEGEESQAGQTCQCPMCGMAFIIPAPLAAVPTEASPVGGWSPGMPNPNKAPSEFPEPASGFPQVGPGFQAQMPGVEKEPQLLHIPCPNGHELEVPPEMLNEDVLCPHCGAQFKLKEKNSVEFIRKQQEEEDKKFAKSGKLWFNWAIVFAFAIVIFLLVLIFAGGGQ
jgi:hypothetical protein